MIHTYGDSHSMFGWRDVNITRVTINHLGPKLMYSFGRDNSVIVNSNVLQSGHSVVFCFGEIDCRCHVHKYVNKDNKNFEDIIDNITSLYVQTVNKNVFSYKNHNVKTYIYSVPPPIKRANGTENIEFPFLGTDYERLSYHRYMNESLRQKCIENDLLFFDVYSCYSDSEGFLISGYSDGICHIKNPIYIEEKIREYGLNNV